MHAGYGAEAYRSGDECLSSPWHCHIASLISRCRGWGRGLPLRRRMPQAALVFVGSAAAALCGGDTRRGCLKYRAFAIAIEEKHLVRSLCDHLHRWCSADSEGGESRVLIHTFSEVVDR